MRPPVLIVLHGELSTPGRVAIQLRNRDIPLDVRRPRFGDELPKTLERAQRRGHLRRAAERQRRRRVRQARDRLDRRAAEGEEAVSRHLPRRADAGEAARRPGLQACRRPRRGRLLPDPPDRRRPRRLQGLARPCLSMASRGLRPAGQGGDAGRGRFVSGAGLQLRRHRLCAAIPHGRHPRHDVPLDHARPRAHDAAERQAARDAISRAG